MSEHELISAQGSESHPYEWPVWEVQGFGTVTGAGEAPDGAARCEIRPPWVDIRLTFADGARIDVLVVVREGRIAVEEAQADPPLEWAGFAALAGVIEAPLNEACRMVVGQVGTDLPGTAPPEQAGGGAIARGPVLGSAAPGDTVTGMISAGAPHGELPSVCELPVQDLPAPAPATADAAPWVGEIVPEERPAGEFEPVEPVEPSVPLAGSVAPGRRRARPSLPRGSLGRRGVAEIYRRAQGEGDDPVLAVMSATGFSRRKSLRLISGARDDGHLTPRHQRR